MNIGLGALRFFNRVLRDGRNGGFQAGIQGLRSRRLPLRNQSRDKGVRFKFGWIAGVAECIPSANNPELRRMLLVAHGSLCLIDTTDAALRSNGNMIQFMLRSNLIAWTRFSMLALKELKAFYREGSMDVDAVDDYLEAEYRRLL